MHNPRLSTRTKRLASPQRVTVPTLAFTTPIGSILTASSLERLGEESVSVHRMGTSQLPVARSAPSNRTSGEGDGGHGPCTLSELRAPDPTSARCTYHDGLSPRHRRQPRLHRHPRRHRSPSLSRAQRTPDATDPACPAVAVAGCGRWAAATTAACTTSGERG